MDKGRPKKVRYVQSMPMISQFSPRGRAGRPDEVELRVDHFEAIKLADHQGYGQSEGARFMGVSRATFGRILREARKVVSNAIVNGKSIHIRTGDVQIGVRRKGLPNKRDNLRAMSSEVIIRKKISGFKE